MPLQIWRPDTCGCAFAERHGEGGGVTCEYVVAKCAAHATVADADLYGVVYSNSDGENKRKNKIWKQLVEAGIGVGQLGADGSYELKPGVFINLTWSGTAPNRVVTVSVTGVTLTAGQKAAAQTWCNNQFGAGKAIVA